MPLTRPLTTAPPPPPRFVPPYDHGYQLVDGDGRVLDEEWTTRGDAIRHMGVAAMQGAALPLRVRRPDGTMTGDALG